MLLTDHAVFIMPEDPELQFPAIASVQKFVNSFHQKMKSADYSGGRATHSLQYDVHMPCGDWELFLAAGLKLDQPPVRLSIEQADILVQLTDDVLLSFLPTGRNCGQVCGVLTGTPAPPVPDLRKVTPKRGGKWGVIVNGIELPVTGMEPVTVVDIVNAESDVWQGMVGYASRETSLALSMGLPVVEVTPVGRPMRWLSKWMCPGYRMVDGRVHLWKDQIRAAVRSVEQEDVLSHRTALGYVGGAGAVRG